MLKDKMSVLISSCDKFSDLWDENIRAYRRFWQDNSCDTYLVTDADTQWTAEGVKVIAAGVENDFPFRIRKALDYVETKYVLVTLDDYYLIDPVYNEKLEYFIERMEKENIQYLSLYNRRYAKPKYYCELEKLTDIDTTGKYALTLYPAIWEVEFFKKTAKADISPWLYEVSLSKTAYEEGANCKESLAGTFNILDVVRKGKLLHKAQRYFKKNGIDIGNRPSISYFTEFKFATMDLLRWHLPRKAFLLLKGIAKKCGMQFYSED